MEPLLSLWYIHNVAYRSCSSSLLMCPSKMFCADRRSKRNLACQTHPCAYLCQCPRSIVSTHPQHLKTSTLARQMRTTADSPNNEIGQCDASIECSLFCHLEACQANR